MSGRQHLIIALLLAWYALALRLYLRRFRDEFGSEMHGAFGAALEDAAAHGLLAVLQVWLREAFTFPVNLVEAHWRSRRGQEPARAELIMAPASLTTISVDREVGSLLVSVAISFVVAATTSVCAKAGYTCLRASFPSSSAA